MNTSASKSAIALSLAGCALSLLLFIPSLAAAQTASANTQELLPPGQNTCQQMTVTQVQPYVYGGILESFDVTISDNSDAYVGVLATVGNTPISLTSITRWAGEPNGLRIHVDTPDTPVGAGLPVKLTLLASLPGQPTCMTTVSFDVTGVSVAPASSTSQSTAPATGSTSSAGSPNTNASGAKTSGTAAQNGTSQTASSSTLNGSTTALLSASAAASSGSIINGICAGSNVYRLWFILLAIYVIIVAIVVFAEPWYIEDSVLGSTATILVPLIALLAFWYFSAACRGASWIPVIACVIAIIGLFLAFREYETMPLLAAPSES